ncbi:MAG: hypothetical protein ACOYL5_04885 [Phototrophicaceae bacterium]|jgi:hypothetical protein
MSVAEIMQQVRQLPLEARKELVKQVVDELAISPKPKRRISEFYGVGAHQYDGTDAQEYVRQLREEWDHRP